MPRRIASSLGFLVAVSLAVGACSSLNDAPAGSGSDATAVPTGSGVAATPNPTDATAEPDASGMTQTDTEWGRIWDALPPSFPVYPGATATTEIGAPASAQFVVPVDVTTATTWTKTALDGAGLRTSVSGPLEDGSMTLDSLGPSGCAAKTTIARSGGVTLMTVLYGANCPFS
jgi:hypothetical protein